jgi:hypothetical protein
LLVFCVFFLLFFFLIFDILFLPFFNWFYFQKNQCVCIFLLIFFIFPNFDCNQNPMLRGDRWIRVVPAPCWSTVLQKFQWLWLC